MTLANTRLVNLNYGVQGRFSYEIDSGRVLADHVAPQPTPQVLEELNRALAAPLDYPPFDKAVIPSDQVVLALDRFTPESVQLIAGTWGLLKQCGVSAEDVVILQPAALPGRTLADPRTALPAEDRQRVRWSVHDPTDSRSCAYLATTTNGERIYLARDVIDADVAVSIGQTCFDPVIGFRGTNSVFYPGLSDAEAHTRAQGLGHSELAPDDVRPMRQMIDEIGWLLGTQFSIQVIPSAAGGVAHVLAGAADSVLRRARELLAIHWLFPVAVRPDLVVAAVDKDAAGHGWDQVSAALAAAHSLVVKGGKILILSELEAELSAGMKLVCESEHPSDVLQLLRASAPNDLIAATQLARAVEWADVYLLSRLDSDLVEDLFAIPVRDESEAHRLLGGDETCVFLSSAQHVCGRFEGP